MSDMILAQSLPVPQPQEAITTRRATLADIPFIDGLQKQYNKNLGFLQTKALEGKIALDQVLVAENTGERLGYIIAQDRYFKRDELGMICQLVIAPGKQRGFIGAALLKAQFDRSAYGCRLYCCWCAQDLEANHFWEAMGFVPLAYRNGSEKKARVHIFWQKKIRGKDDPVNWWFPAKTDQGQIRADRIVLPIPPGVHWKDLQPIVIPGMEDVKQFPAPSGQRVRKPPVVKKKITLASCGLRSAEQVRVEIAASKKSPVREKAPKVKAKIDPKLVAASREFRDRFLEEVNERGFVLESAGKYELTRTISEAHPQPKALKLAA